MQNSNLIKTLGIVIRELRQESGLSQVVFGEKCGFYQTYLSRIENGTANPTINALDVISKALELSIFDLMEAARIKMNTQKDKRVQQVKFSKKKAQ